jgi:uncharacterized protein YdaU (DUF1376 family)
MKSLVTEGELAALLCDDALFSPGQKWERDRAAARIAALVAERTAAVVEAAREQEQERWHAHTEQLTLALLSVRTDQTEAARREEREALKTLVCEQRETWKPGGLAYCACQSILAALDALKETR